VKRLSWQVDLAAALVAVSALLYYVHYLVFRDVRHIFIFLLGDLAFIPIEVAVVALVINRLLSVREKRVLMKKMNMAIGTFYSAMGAELLRRLSRFNLDLERIRDALIVEGDWTDTEFETLGRRLREGDYRFDSRRDDLDSLKRFLAGEREFILGLLENPNLLEHDTFTDLLWAVFHLADELGHRENLRDLPATDHDHLSNDMKRAFSFLVYEWLEYMKHLKEDYPYLFSLAMRTNPFKRETSVIVG